VTVVKKQRLDRTYTFTVQTDTSSILLFLDGGDGNAYLDAARVEVLN